MADPIVIRVLDITGNNLAVSAEDGQIVHDKLAPVLREGQSLRLSFQGVDTVISAFLNAAIGQLYGEFSEEKIRENFSVTDMAKEDLPLLKRVVDNAKTYFRDPERFRKAVEPLVDEDDEE
jgi:hypothetical protein